jgi:hypothetical protein
MIDAPKKPFYVRVIIQSVSDGVENQIVDLTEGAVTAEELTMKCFTLTDAVNDAMKAMAEAGGFPTEIPTGKPKKK